MRKFEVVKNCPFPVKLPVRSTAGSAGYDFFAPYPFVIAPGQSLVVKTWVKVMMPKDNFLKIIARSSWNTKKKIFITCSGIIDSDYYGNPHNDGDILIQFTNRGKEPFQVNPGERIAQGIFLPFFLTNDDEAEGKRVGGMGSTGD